MEREAENLIPNLEYAVVALSTAVYMKRRDEDFRGFPYLKYHILFSLYSVQLQIYQSP